MPVALAFAAATLLIHLLTNGQYGYFRDELYYLACSRHLDWGYSDCAPLIGAIAWAGRTLFGESLHGIRLLPALAGAGKVLLTGMIARELGGGRFAIALACLCALAAPLYLGLDTILTMNAFEPLFWMGCVYLAVRAIRRKQPQLWIWCGALAGLGLENKHSAAFFIAALAGGVLLSPERRIFRTRWVWIAGAVALAIFLPNLIWEQQRNWPIIETLANVRKTHKNVELTPLQFLGEQVLVLSPAAALVWIPGLCWLFFNREGRRWCMLGWTYLLLLGIMLALKAKNYYLAPIYPMLFAAGGIFWERLRPRWPKFAVGAVVATVGALAAPMALPVLAPERLVAWQSALGFAPPKTEVAHAGMLPQLFGDMFGWPEMVDAVAKVYWSLPPEDRAKAAIYAGNYGEAGAIDLFGPRRGLPPAISPHQSYWYWGPRQYTGEVMIVLQGRRAGLEPHFRSVAPAGRVGHPWAMAEENYEIFVCRGLKQPLAEIWPRLKHWN